VQRDPLSLNWTCRACVLTLIAPLEPCVLHWLLSLDLRGTEWPVKIKTRFPTPLIESHTLDFWHAFRSWSSNPKANLSDHAELKWIYPTTPRTCRFRVIEVGVRCFESVPVFLAFPTARRDLAFQQFWSTWGFCGQIGLPWGKGILEDSVAMFQGYGLCP